MVRGGDGGIFGYEVWTGPGADYHEYILLFIGFVQSRLIIDS